MVRLARAGPGPNCRDHLSSFFPHLYSSIFCFTMANHDAAAAMAGLAINNDDPLDVLSYFLRLISHRAAGGEE